MWLIWIFWASFLLIQWLTPVSMSITFKFKKNWVSLLLEFAISTSAMNQFRELAIFASISLQTMTKSPGKMSINLIILPFLFALDSLIPCPCRQSGWSVDWSGWDNTAPPALPVVMARISEFLKSSCAHLLEMLDMGVHSSALSRFPVLFVHSCCLVHSFASSRLVFYPSSWCVWSFLRFNALLLLICRWTGSRFMSVFTYKRTVASCACFQSSAFFYRLVSLSSLSLCLSRCFISCHFLDLYN